MHPFQLWQAGKPLIFAWLVSISLLTLGVATYVRDSGTPWKAEEGLSGGFRSDNEEENIGFYGDQSEFSDEELQALDNEGRTIMTQHKMM